MTQQEDKYTTCDRCEAHILEKCAYDEQGQTLCGACIATAAEKEAAQAAQKAQQLRHEQAEQEKIEVAQQQQRKTTWILILALFIFAAVQGVLYLNQPKPVPSAQLELKQNSQLPKSLILMAVSEYMSEKCSPPAQLKLLVPDYLPTSFLEIFPEFDYRVDADGAIYLAPKVQP